MAATHAAAQRDEPLSASAGTALDVPFDRLDALPRGLWLGTLVTSAGTPERRLDDVAGWRAALMEGALPDAALDFGDAQATAPLRAVVGELELPALARGTPAMVEQVLRTLLWHLDRILDHQPRLARAEAIDAVAGEFRDAWTLEKAGWEEMLALMQGLGDLGELRWDQLQGHLRSRAWQVARRAAERLAQLQPLVELIRRLGRAERVVAPRPRPQPEARADRAVPTRWRETRLADAPGELKGIHLDDRIERMLGAEALLITHPVLHKLWRARFAERRLLCYDSEAVLVERVVDPAGRAQPATELPDAESAERGPMLIAVDTSGSMKGAPENVAKALVLQVLRTAHAERRACRLLAFGGPGELVEHELALTPTGLDALMAVMGQSFDGGTDLQMPIERAIERVHEAQWRSADLLVVSDGEFGCTPATLAQLDRAREELGLRVQGILIGDRETMGLLDTCDDIYWLRDWRRHADEGERTPGDAGFTPVHSQSLTALYFPNALSPRAARHRDAR
jgi:uncharacterized protein with von Willebrand factor type A (vWA) domain